MLPKLHDRLLLREKVYQILKKYIIEGLLAEGSKITEAEISKQMGVSITPVREAIRKLVMEGFITLHSNKRMSISRVSAQDIIEVYQIRKALCCYALREFTESIQDEYIFKFGEIIREMELAADKNDVIKYSELADLFHSLLIKLSKNRKLESICTSLHEQVYRYRIKSLKVRSRINRSLNEHKNIYEALKKHDPELSSNFCQKHLDNALENILNNTMNNN